MTKRNNRGFTLIETLAALIVVVLLVVGIGAGMKAATKSYKNSLYQSNSGTLHDILITSISDILRFSDSVKLGTGTDTAGYEFTFKSKDYNVKNCSFTLSDEATIDGVSGGYLMLHTVDKDGKNPTEVLLVNSGSYAGDLVLTSFSAKAFKAANDTGYYFDISYTIQDINDADHHDTYSFRVRQINADLPADTADQGDDGEGTTVDADCIYIIYNQNTSDAEAPAFTDVFGNSTRSVTQILYPSSGTTFTTESSTMSRTYYTCKGWNTLPEPTDSNPGTHYDAGEKVTLTEEEVNTYAGGELNLYAEWECIEYTLKYDTNGGKLTKGDPVTAVFTIEEPYVKLYSGENFEKTVTAHFDTNILSPNTGTKSSSADANYSLVDGKEWSTVSTGKGTYYEQGESIDATKIDGFNSDEKTVTLYANWSTSATLTLPTSQMYRDWGTSKKYWNFMGWIVGEADLPEGDSGRYSTGSIIDPEETPTVTITKETTFYAQYNVQVGYSNLGGKNTPTAQTHQYKIADLSVPDKTPTKAGYTFLDWYDGWSDSENKPKGNRLFYVSDTQKRTNPAEYMAEQADKSVTYWYAGWKINPYSIAYVNKYNGSELSGVTNTNPTTYDVEDLPITLKDPTCTGYVFEGWYDSTGSKVEEIAENTTGALTYYGKWRPIKYTITFDGNNKTGGSMSNMECNYGTSYNLNENKFTRTGYTFTGWKGSNGKTYTDKASFSNLTTVDGTTITLTAQWTANSYTITYNGNNSTGGSTADTPATYDKNVTLRSNGFTRQYTMTYKYKINGTVNTVSGLADTYTKAVWSFKEWNTDPNGNGTSYSAGQSVKNLADSGSAILYAIWNSNSGKVTYPQADTTPTAWHNHWLLEGWGASESSKTPNMNGSAVKTGQQLTADTAVYAILSRNITLDANGGSVSSSTLKYTSIESAPSLPDPTRTGYTFNGWYTAASGGNKVTSLASDSIYTSDGSLTLYAQWTIKSYTIQYSVTPSTYKFENGETVSSPSGEPDSVQKDYNTTHTIPAEYRYTTSTAKIGNTEVGTWTFDGWYKGESKVTSFKVDGDVTLTGTWTFTPKTYTVTISSSGSGSVSPTTVSSVPYGTVITESSNTINVSGTTVTATPSTGYHFKNWTNGAGTVTGNKTITANFEIEKYTVTLEIDHDYRSFDFSLDVKRNGSSQTEQLYKKTSISKDETKTYTNIEYGSILTFTKSSNVYGVTVDTGSGETSWDSGEYKVVGNVTVTVYGKDFWGGCIASGTSITMADGSHKNIEDVMVGENILTFDHDTGKLSSAPVAYVFKEERTCDILKLRFANGTKLTILDGHGFYDKAEKQYVVLNADNIDEYIGHWFYCADTQKYTRLLSYTYSRELTEAYSILSAYDINHVANGMLCVSDDIEGLFNIFECDSNMKVIESKKQADIEKYGLVTYDMFADYCTEEEFDVFNCKYLGIAVGKGLTTYESLAERMIRFSGNSANTQ